MRSWFDKLIDGIRGRSAVLVLFDILCFAAVCTLFFAISVVAANSLPVDETAYFLLNCVVHLVLLVLMRLLLGIYNNIWRYADTRAYMDLVAADGLAGVVTLLLLRVLHLFVPGAYYGLWQPIFVGALTALTALFSRFAYCLLYKTRFSKTKTAMPRRPVAIIGAGRLGSSLVEDLRNNPNSGYAPLFFVDVDASKIGHFVGGLKVYDLETGHELIQRLEVEEVLVTVPSEDSDRLAELYRCYTALGCKIRMCEPVTSNASKKVLRDVSIEDLLFRKPVDFGDESTMDFYRGKTVLITGGGGSIGSELCRRIAGCSPEKLVIFDFYENNAYEIQQELLRQYGDGLNLVVEIGSVREPERLAQVFAAHRPQIVFHAAAHKHVPLMEQCGAEAVKNNVLGTYYTANAAEACGVETFILISTDKAVNPTNIMGATKRLCEMVVQCRTDSQTSFAAVRFGNVLGSNGSVIPLFRKQIEQGGPVTVTDKRIIRYFMTIPEASQLVVQAGVMAKAGELFVLDMGKPVKIYDLAETMIRLSGLEPGKDIEIREIGLRPGEKLYEELLIKSEQVDTTENSMIFIERDTPRSRAEVEQMLQSLQTVLHDSAALKKTLAAIVPTYCDAAEVNRSAEATKEMMLASKQ